MRTMSGSEHQARGLAVNHQAHVGAQIAAFDSLGRTHQLEVRKEGPGARVLEHERVLGRREPIVERHQHEPEPGTGEGNSQVLRAVEGEQRDAVSTHESQAGERGGGARDLVGKGPDARAFMRRGESDD